MKIIIVGCTHAGTMAATQALQDHPEAEVTIYERNANVSFLSCGISLYMSGDVKRLEDMFYSSPEELRDLGATVNIGYDVLRVDARRHTVHVFNMQTKAVSVDTYDKLIMATGSAVKIPPLEGIDNKHILLCKDYNQARQLYERAQDAQNIAIVGGGYVGVELAESFVRTKHKVALFHSEDYTLNGHFDREIGQVALNQLQDAGVELHMNSFVNKFTASAAGNIALQTASACYVADIAIVATGFVPNSDLVRTQVDTNRVGAILVNEYGQTSDPDIYAAGDCATSHYNLTETDAYTPLASIAIRQGRLVGINVFGNKIKALGTQASSAISLFGECYAAVGLTFDRAQKLGIDAGYTVYNGTWRPEYMPTTDALTIALVFNRKTREIIGAQFYSKHEVAQSANAISIAIQNHNTIDDLAMVDMLFQPNFDFPFNFLNLVAQDAIAQEKERGHHTPLYNALY